MQIVIDIPKKVYEAIKSGFYTSQDRYDALDAVQDGTPLPDKHGRIIDESKITKCEQTGLIIKDDNVTRCLVTDAPTILEAKRGE